VIGLALQGFGYMGSILYLNLTEGKSRKEELDEETARSFLGGKGLGALLLHKTARKGVDPLSPGNPLIFSTGPLTGTIAPTGNRFAVVTKSPLTGAFLDCHCGGPFGIWLKRAGYDAIVLTGACDEPSVVTLKDGGPEIAPAHELWGKFTDETEATLKQKLGDDIGVACIGPAGERRAAIAGVFSGLRTAGRGGAGAVMGSKNLKAIVASGDNAICVKDIESFRKAAWSAHRLIRMNETTIRQLPRYGTDNILEVVNVMGGFPTKNFQQVDLEGLEPVFGDSWRRDTWVRDTACVNCPIGCSKVAHVRSGKYGGAICEGPDYETIWALGPNCGITSRDAIVKANEICDKYGLDTISTGGTISYVMECVGRGLLKPDDLDGIDARFGDEDALLRIVEKMASGEGVGRTLQDGTKRSVREFSKVKGTREFERYAMEVKGMELPGYEPRAAQGMALGYATSDRGACHLRAYTASQELLGYGGGVDPQALAGKAQLVVEKQNEKAVVDSVGLCFFSFFAITLKEIRRMVVAATGLEYETTKDIEVVGERIYNLTRLFNVREGLSAKDDYLPRRFLEEPLSTGAAKGHMVTLGSILSEYYALREWDQDGIPKTGKLEQLGLSWLA